VAPKRNVFLEKILLIQPLKSPSPGQKLYKRIPFSCHTCPLPLLWHEFDNCLCNFPQSKVSCCLHMYFLWSTICLLRNRKMIKMVTLIHLHIVFYFKSSCFGNDNKFLLPIPWVVLFFTYPTFYSKFCLPNPFLFGTTPTINLTSLQNRQGWSQIVIILLYNWFAFVNN
jgi:hypothetical protein